jgi:tryptophan-rich sensory protein
VLALVGFVGLCLLVGAVGGMVTARSVGTWYLSLTRPPGTPPPWVFGPVWTTLYVMIGVAGWLVWRRTGPSGSIRLWGWQLLVNAIWTPAFFGLRSPALGLVLILGLLALVAQTIRAFARIDRHAAFLMTPYFIWSCYATWLNAGIWWLNPHS